MKMNKRYKFIFVVLTLFILHPFTQAAEGGYSNYIPGFYGDVAMATEPATN